MAAPDVSLLDTCLWDLRAAAESKLRCLTKAQHQLMSFREATRCEERTKARNEIIAALDEILGVTDRLRVIAEASRKAASELPAQ